MRAPAYSFRFGAERLARIDKQATANGMTRHAAVLALIDHTLDIAERFAAKGQHMRLDPNEGDEF